MGRFLDRIEAASLRTDSLVCVGLDTDPAKLPDHLPRDPGGVVEFNSAVIEATRDLVCAYKPNAAFYEAMGSRGVEALERTCAAVPEDIPVILDVKRGDIGNTAERYAAAAYDVMDADAVTVNPYMGFDAVKPFLRNGRCVFVLCLTSNRSAGDFQFLDSGGFTLYERVARAAVQWSAEGEVGLVVGATKPEQMAHIREIVGGDMPILVPGVGAQGGDLEGVMLGCGGNPGRTVVNSSRGIIFASGGRDFADAARSKARELRDAINAIRA